MHLQLRVLIFAAATWPALSQSKPVAVTVYINGSDDSAQLLVPGKLLATHMFKTIGVQVNWRTGQLGAAQSSKPEPAFGIRTLEHAPKSATPEALASARIVGSAGTEIAIYEDRFRSFLDNHSNLAAVAAAYVLTHELAHVMQGVSRHSETGILKAHWSNGDYQEMRYQKLAFTDLDVALIHKGLATQLQLLGAPSAGVSEAKGDVAPHPY